MTMPAREVAEAVAPIAMRATPGRPVVSVLMLTYCHESFIEKAIASVLMQKTRFAYELVIGEDHSPDATARVAQRYAEMHPDRIRLFARPENLGMMQNLVRTLDACTGKYIACLEGDDYWTDETKLQTQVDALESHPEWSLCFHAVRWVSEDESECLRLEPPEGTPDVVTLDDVLRRYSIPSLSIVFRRESLPELPEWFTSLPMGDWPLVTLLATRGSLGYVRKNMADYRVHGGGSYSGASEVKRQAADLAFYRAFRPVLGADQQKLVTGQLVRRTISIIALQLAAREYRMVGNSVRTLFEENRAVDVLPPLLRAVARRVGRPVLQNPNVLARLPMSWRHRVQGWTRQ